MKDAIYEAECALQQFLDENPHMIMEQGRLQLELDRVQGRTPEETGYNRLLLIREYMRENVIRMQELMDSINKGSK
jgi:hypothetical protein